MDNPVYVLPQIKVRALLPKIISLALLGFIFYMGILLNVNLLDLRAAQETTVKTGSMIFLALVVGIGIVLAVLKSKTNYKFYADRITAGKKMIYLREIMNTEPHVDFMDKMFKTCSINLGKDVILRNIHNDEQITNYVKQMVTYAKTTS